MLDALPDALLEADASGRILWANEVFVTIFGYDQDVLRGQPASLIAGPYASQKEGKSLAELISRGEGSLELTAFNHEGVSFPSLVRVKTPQADKNRRLVVVTDVSERDRLRAELVIKAERVQREKEMLRATTESIAEGVLVIDDSERLVLVNGTACQLLGLSEASGHALASVDLPGVLRGRWLAFLAGKQKFDSQTIEIELPTGAKTLLVQMAKVLTNQGVPMGSVMVVADAKEEGVLRFGRDELVGALSQKLRTPLASIRGFVATLLEEPDLDADVRREFHEILRKDTARLSSLTENLIELAQLQSGQSVVDRHAVDLTEVIKEAVNLVCDESGVDCQSIALDLPGSPIIASVDRRRIRNVFAELLRNAVQHGWSERGVKISLRVDETSATAEVRDWGAGPTRADIDQFSENVRHFGIRTAAGRAAQAKLGLTLCQQVLRQHSGELHLEQPDDGGVQAVLRLPL